MQSNLMPCEVKLKCLDQEHGIVECCNHSQKSRFCAQYNGQQVYEISFSIAELSSSQVDVLWHCLVCDSESSDDTLEWFLQQAQSKEFHALDAAALQYIFTEKVLYMYINGVLI